MMKFRFGYVSMSLALWKSTPSGTLTFKRYSELPKEERTAKLLETTKRNLDNTVRMLYYNAAHEIPLYRFSSSLVPLASHPEAGWDFVSPFKEEWAYIGRFVREHDMKVSFHPSQYTLFTSPRPEVTVNAVTDMAYHYQMLEAMGLSDASRINIHVGGAYGDKPAASARFAHNLRTLPSSIKQQMTLENDDKTYTAEETLSICQTERIPMVYDYHHDYANPGSRPFEELLPGILATWEHTGLTPVFHLSSPREGNNRRAHAEYVDLHFIRPLLNALTQLKQDADFMIEAKAKDLAMLKLIDDISQIRGFKRISGGTIVR